MEAWDQHTEHKEGASPIGPWEWPPRNPIETNLRSLSWRVPTAGTKAAIMAISRRNMRNHMQPFDVIHLPGDVACPKEIVEANLPNGDVKQVLLLYDTGATMTTGTQDVTLLDQRYRPAITGPITTTGVNSKLIVS